MDYTEYQVWVKELGKWRQYTNRDYETLVAAQENLRRYREDFPDREFKIVSRGVTLGRWKTVN